MTGHPFFPKVVNHAFELIFAVWVAANVFSEPQSEGNGIMGGNLIERHSGDCNS